MVFWKAMEKRWLLDLGNCGTINNNLKFIQSKVYLEVIAMKVVNFTQIKDELINNMRRKMLIPVIGSGFTRGCDAYKVKSHQGKIIVNI